MSSIRTFPGFWFFPTSSTWDWHASLPLFFSSPPFSYRSKVEVQKKSNNILIITVKNNSTMGIPQYLGGQLPSIHCLRYHTSPHVGQ